MLKHENPNIEVLHKNLYGVRFSLIPLIPQLSWKLDPSVNTNDVPLQFSADLRAIFLNKDFKFYPLLKKAYSAVIRMKSWQIRKEIAKIGDHPRNDPYSIVYWGVLKDEELRRKMVKGGAG